MSSASNITHSEFFGDSRQIVEKILHFLIQGVGYKGQIVSVYKVQIVSLYKVLNSISKKGSLRFGSRTDGLLGLKFENGIEEQYVKC